MERRLAAILAADVVGYSALMERDEAGTFARLKAGRKELFEPEIERHHGRIFKLMGDGLLAEFASVVDAVECAVSLQRGLAERNLSVPESERIQVRVGVNLGEVIVEGDDRYGEGVNIATRLEQLAEAGDVYVSGKVANEVAKKLAFGFEAMGEQKVKNIAEPVSVYRVRLDGDKKSRLTAAPRAHRSRVLAAGLAGLLLAIAAAYAFLHWQGQSSTSSLPGKASIAVLPFANLSDDPQQGYFADGVAEDLMTDLSRISGLFVASRNSAFVYKGKSVDLREVGRDLGVRHVLEGSVRRAGDILRINVQLIETTTGGHVWAERYEGSQADIFALQDQVTKAVVAALALRLTPGEQAVMGERETQTPEAYDAFLRGWEYYQRTTADDFLSAIPYFEKAIGLDPNYGRAHAALAMVYFRSYDQRWASILGMSADDAFRKARDHLELAQARPSALSHQVAGNISRQRGWYDDAFKEFAAAIALEPNDAWSYADLAFALIEAGRPAEALTQIETAIRLDPRAPPIFVFYRGLALFAQDRNDEALKAFEEAFRLSPQAPWVGLFLASAYGKTGRKAEALEAVAAYSAARVNEGGVPFVMRELRHPGDNVSSPMDIKPPQEDRLTQGLISLNIPTYLHIEYAKQQLTGDEIKTLLFGHRIHGRTQGEGKDYGLSISAEDGLVTGFGLWDTGWNKAFIRDQSFCIASSTTEWCLQVFRNPGGSRARQNEYYLYDGWALPFSQMD